MRTILLVSLCTVVLLGGAGLLAKDRSPAEILKSADRSFEQKTWKQAIEAYREFLEAAPDDERAFHAKIRIGRAMLEIRDRWNAIQWMEKLVPETKEGSRERAEVQHRLGAAAAEYSGGSKETVARLTEAEAIYAERGLTAERIRVLFDLAAAYSGSWSYEVDYKAWEKEYWRENPEEIEVPWNDYQIREWRKVDEERYRRIVETYERIVKLAGGKGNDAANALLRLGAFHGNVLAGAFRTGANYYSDLADADLSEEMERVLGSYTSEVEKGLAVWERLIAERPDDSLADDARYFIAYTCQNRLNDFVRAEAQYERLLAEYPDTEWKDTALAALQSIRQEDINLQVPGPFPPGEPSEIELSARNVEKIRFTAFRLDVPSLLRGDYWSHDVNAVDTARMTPFASWEVDTGATADHRGVQLAVALPFDSPGTFLIHADGDRRTCRTLVVITKLAFAMKTAADECVLFSTDAATGAPAADVSYVVKARWRRGREWITHLFDAKSGGDGLARVDLSSLPSTGTQLAVVGTKAEQVALSDSYRAWRSSRDRYRVFTYTDRPVYRPDQTVHFRSIVRSLDDPGYGLPDGKPVAVQILDPKGAKLYEQVLVTDADGTIAGDLALGEEPALGMYQVRVTIDGRQYRTRGWSGVQFRVEEYKKPEYEVTVAAAPRVEPGAKVKAKVEARYYFGAPVANAELKYRVFRQAYRHFMPVPRRYDWYYTDLYPAPAGWHADELVTEGAGLTGEDGTFSVEFDAKKYADDMDSRYRIEADVTDASRREIRGSATLFATAKPFFVQVEPVRALFKPGDAVEVTIRAEDANKSPVKSEGKLVLARRVDREEKDEDGETKTVVDWTEVGNVPAATREDGTGEAKIVVDAEGQYRLTYVVPLDGTESVTGEGSVTGEAWAWVVSRDFRGSQYRFANVEVLTDRDTCAIGDEVEVLVNTHVEDPWVLLSVEAGDEILFRQVVKVEGKSHVAKLTVGEGWTPNVWVKALLIRDGAVWTSRRQLIVPPVGKFLDLRLAPVKEGTYRPGEEGEFTLTAIDAAGEPVEGEFSVGFIDKSILYIQSDLTPDIRQFFYGNKRRDLVRLTSSFDFRHTGRDRPKPGFAPTKYRTLRTPDYLNPWRYRLQGMRGELQQEWTDGAERLGMARGFGGRGGHREEAKKGAAPGAPPAARKRRSADRGLAAGEEEEDQDKGDDFAADGKLGEGASGEAPAARKFFPDTAYWNAHVTTGKDGKATVKVVFPDSLTTWKASANGATRETAVGAASAEYTTTKNVIVRLAAPRFFRERDEVVVSGIVRNGFKDALPVEVSVAAEGGCLEMLDRGELSKPTLGVTIPGGKEQRIDWWFRVTRPGRVKITATARSERESDAMQLGFPVYEHGVEKVTALSGSMTGAGGKPAGDGKAIMSFAVPEDRHEDATVLTVTVNPSLASALLETLPFLADYPYGCTEQTMSRFLPSVVVKKTLGDLGFSLEDLGVGASREVPEGFWGRPETEKLKALRTEDLERIVAAGAKRLADFQNADGSWGWWKGSSPDLLMTAYVVRGLALAKRAGADVDVEMAKRGIEYLFGQLKNTDPAERRDKGMTMSGDLLVTVAGALLDAGTPRGEGLGLAERIVGWLYETREDLGAVSKARLAIALLRLGRTEEAKIVCENLTDFATIDRENGTCRFGRVEGFVRWRDDAVTATAETLRAYLAIVPENELIPMMVRWLVNNRRGSHWKSTMDTAYATLALCDYLKASKELTPDYTVKIDVDGRVTKSIRVTKANLFTLDNALTLKGGDLPAGTHRVTVEKTGEGNLYYAGALTVFTREEDVKGAGNEIGIARRAWKIVPRTREAKRTVWVNGRQVERSYTEVYEEKEALASGATLSVGDEIEMELVITAKNDYRYLVFADMKGAGFEATELKSGGAYSGILSYRELRDERADFFVSNLPQGEHRLSYRLRAEIPGDYHVMPAEGFAMYFPDVRAISDEMRLSVTEPGVR